MEDKKRREIKEERTAASKLFENEDHSFTKEIYLDDVHYQDEEGIWQEMDDTLTEEMDEDTEADQEENMAEEYAASERAEKDFANRKGKWKVVFRKHSRKQGTVSVTKDAYKISWALENAEKVKAEETGTNAVLYPDILPGTDSRFCVRGKSIKEDIILKTPEAIGSFTWLYHTKKLHPVAGNSCVRFVNDAEEEIFADRDVQHALCGMAQLHGHGGVMVDAFIGDAKRVEQVVARRLFCAARVGRPAAVADRVNMKRLFHVSLRRYHPARRPSHRD